MFFLFLSSASPNELVVRMCPGFLQDLAGINNLEVKSKYSLNETSFP